MHQGHVSVPATLFLVLALASACGTTGGTSGGPPDGGGEAGPPDCLSGFFPQDGAPCDKRGQECRGAATPCAYNPSCPVCPETKATCGDDGRWRVTTTTPACPNLCPSVFPKAGERCDIRDLECAEPARPCASPCECPRLVATCRDGAWDVVDTYTPPPSCRNDAGSDASPADGGSDAEK